VKARAQVQLKGVRLLAGFGMMQLVAPSDVAQLSRANQLLGQSRDSIRACCVPVRHAICALPT